jgi:hypothetical protein
MDTDTKFINALRNVLTAICDGTLADYEVEGTFRYDAFHAYEAFWNRKNDGFKRSLTVRKHSIFEEIYWVMESFCPSDSSDGKTWEDVRAEIARLFLLLDREDVDEYKAEFTGWCELGA